MLSANRVQEMERELASIQSNISMIRQSRVRLEKSIADAQQELKSLTTEVVKLIRIHLTTKMTMVMGFLSFRWRSRL